MKINLITFALVSFCILGTSSLMAEENSIVINAQPEVNSPELMPTPASADPATLVPNVAVTQDCVANIVAARFTIMGLFRCGTRIRDSGLIGVINRRTRRCTEEGIVADVFTSMTTCDNCATRSAARQIRWQRLFASACECPEYIAALAQDLGSTSTRMRLAARRSLRVCGFRVVESTACIAQPLPHVVMY